jgi:hypothetical protein
LREQDRGCGGGANSKVSRHEALRFCPRGFKRTFSLGEKKQNFKPICNYVAFEFAYNSILWFFLLKKECYFASLFWRCESVTLRVRA